MAGLEGIDATSMQVVDALQARWTYDPGKRVARPLVRHLDFLPVARVVDGERVIERMRFGLPGQGGRIVTNARDDKLATSPAWRGLVARSPGLVAISYVVERGKQGTYKVQRRDGAMIVVPALVARRHYRFASTGNAYDDVGHVQVTADANSFVAQVHDRFVCELATPAARDAWLDPEASAEQRRALLAPAPNDRYEMVPIAPDVWTRRDDPEATRAKGKPIVWPGQTRLDGAGA